MKIKYDKNYNFEIDTKFGSLSPERVNKKFQDGRVASHFLELQLEEWFPELTFVNARGYDHIRKGSDILYDQKCFTTTSGLKFAPSKMLGGGRKIDLKEAHAHANTIDYIACDIVDFPKVTVRFVKGSDLVKRYPSCLVKVKQRAEFFNY
mgnify:CR=1 FL=1|tara:strand:+ start:2222 stop:2671 length:450 start_codon:yes stop_codon:yes gene_type:complete